MLGEGVTLKCTECAKEYTLDEFGMLKSDTDTEFSFVSDWFKWQRKIIAKEVQSDDFCLSTRVKIGKINVKKLDNNYSILFHGEGVLTLTNKGLTYQGEYDGEKVDLFFDPGQVYSLSMSLNYDLDMYYKNDYFNFKLLQDEKQVAKWMICAEEIHNLYDDAWKKVSEEVYEYGR
jgi:hypothetical protein